MDNIKILAIDPGNERSAYVCYERHAVTAMDIPANTDLVEWLPGLAEGYHVAIEMIASYGMPVGREVFETCVWIGRFQQAIFPQPVQLIYRREVKLALCNSVKAKDANIRAAIADLFGGMKRCKGTKAAPGPLYGVKEDIWAALGVALTASAQGQDKPR